jgi:hypothetical protein
MRAFVRLQKMMLSNKGLARKLEQMKKYEAQFKCNV